VSNAAPVVIAAADIQRGVAITPTMLRLVSYPRDAVPAGAFGNAASLVGDPAKPRIALRAIGANEPILPSAISGPNGNLNLSGAVGPGMRAVSLRSNDVAGVGGFVLPGDRVDVFLTRSVGTGDKQETVTQTIAENILVLGVDQSADDQSSKPVVAKAVTVEVTPEQAQAISLGQSVGTVSLALRHPADNEPLARNAMTVADLGFGGTPHGRVWRGGGGTGSVHVYRGTADSIVSFGSGVGAALQGAAKPAGMVQP
jgi:pilus assembly protein CpaB